MFLTNCKPIKFSISKTFKTPPDSIIIIIEQNAYLFFLGKSSIAKKVENKKRIIHLLQTWKTFHLH